METINIENSNQNKEEIEKKLKQDITKFYSQIKNGCFRKNCYNPYCKNSNEKTYKNEKEILTQAMTLARNSDYSLNFCVNTKNFLIKYDQNDICLEDFIYSFDDNLSIEKRYFYELDRLPPLNLNYKKLNEIFDTIEILEFMKIVNNFWEFIYKDIPFNDYFMKENLKNKSYIKWNFYIHYINMRILVMVSLHPNFNYSAESHDILNNFLKNVNQVDNNFKKFISFYKGGYLSIENYSKENSINSMNLNTNDDKISNILENDLINNQKKSYGFNEIFNFFSVKKIENNINNSKNENEEHFFSYLSKLNSSNLTSNISLDNELLEIELEKEKNKAIYFYKISQLKLNIKSEAALKLLTKTSRFNEMSYLTKFDFFDTFFIFRNFYGYSIFIDFINNIEKFQNIINNYQNFLLLIIMIGSENETDFNSFTNILNNFMSIFEIFYKANEILQIVKIEEFYNEYINKNVEINFLVECKNYLKYLKSINEEGENKIKFCWVRFFFIFNSKSKSEILFEFNCKMQRDEFLNQINNLGSQMLFNPMVTNPYLIIEIKRNSMIENSLNFLVNSQLNFKKQLKVKFIGEQGIDEGGVKKEYFLLLVRQLFNSEYGMFSYNEKTRFFWFNTNSFESTLKFELIGIIFGLAFFNNVILDVKFPLVVFKKLLDIKPNLEDLKEIDEDLYNNFCYLLNSKERDLRNILMTTFAVTVENFGEKIIIPLKPNGDEIFIDENNRFEYVDLYLDWYFNKSIEKFFNKFYEGFYRVCDNKIFHILKAEELELIICGSQILDFIQLENSARYQDGFEETSLTIKLFWEVVHEFNYEEKKKFLLFLTGCDRAPLDGLGSLIITISRFGPDSDKLPSAHTCFNHLLLPEYQDKDKMRNRLLIAINHSEGFGLL